MIVQKLMMVRKQVELALNDPRDAAFEAAVQDCREARIQDSKAVKARLKAIDQPRTVLAELTTAVSVFGLVQRAFSLCARVPACL